MPEETDIKSALAQELAKVVPDPKKIAKLSDALLDAEADSVRFTVDAQHINRLGLELVGKQETALSELIKNAYDADATSVEIEFDNYDKVGGSLVVKDNGVGMDAHASCAARSVTIGWPCDGSNSASSTSWATKSGKHPNAIAADRSGAGSSRATVTNSAYGVRKIVCAF